MALMAMEMTIALNGKETTKPASPMTEVGQRYPITKGLSHTRECDQTSLWLLISSSGPTGYRAQLACDKIILSTYVF